MSWRCQNTRVSVLSRAVLSPSNLIKESYGEDISEDYSHYGFTEETVAAIKVLQLEPAGVPAGVREGYDDNWFYSPRTDYEQFKADLTNPLHPEIVNSEWKPYELDGGGEMLHINLVLFYYLILLFNRLDGVYVNVQPFD